MQYIRIQDPIKHDLRRSYIRAKCQAKYRCQIWDLGFEDYVEIWMRDDNHSRKGRGSDNLHMSRIDTTKGWSANNVQIIQRGEHLSKRMLKYYGTR